MIDGLARTATIPELIWTFCGIVPSLITSYGLWYWIRLLGKYRERRVNGRSHLQAQGHVAEHVLLLMAKMLIVASGVFQMTQPPANPETPVTPGNIFTTTCVVGIAVLLTLHSITVRIVWNMVSDRTKRAHDRSTDPHESIDDESHAKIGA
jgi:hypothetical protein